MEISKLMEHLRGLSGQDRRDILAGLLILEQKLPPKLFEELELNYLRSFVKEVNFEKKLKEENNGRD